MATGKVYLEWKNKVEQVNGEALTVRAPFVDLAQATIQARYDITNGREVNRIVVVPSDKEAAYLDAKDNYWAEKEKSYSSSDIMKDVV